MKWATRKGMKTDRVACAWLVEKHIDPDAEFHFFDAATLLEDARAIDATTFDAAGADFGHDGMKCTFEVMLERFDLAGKDAALDHMGVILNSSDVRIKLYDFSVMEGFGVWALAQGFAESLPDDHDKLTYVVPMYEALYQWCKLKVGKMKQSTYSPTPITI